MTVVPTMAEKVLGEESPIQGDLNDVAAQRGVVQDVAAEAGSFLWFVGDAAQLLSEQESDGVSKIAVKLDERVKPGAKALIDSADATLRSLDSYANEIQQLHQRAMNVIGSVEIELVAIRVASQSIDRICAELGVRHECAWDEGPVWIMPEPQPGQNANVVSPEQWTPWAKSLRSAQEESWQRATSIWHGAIDEIHISKRSWHELVEQRKQAERRLSGALSLTVIGQLITLGAAEGAGYRPTITMAISGELWGVAQLADGIATEHPLLARLIGTRSGENAWDSPPDSFAVAAAWEQLNEAERKRLIDEVPGVIGNLPGLPFAVRDQANRQLLEYYVVNHEGLGETHQAAVDEIMKVLEKERQEVAHKGQATPPIQIVALNLRGSVPKSAIGYGDLDAAENLTWQIPGMGNDTQQGLPGWDKASRNLYGEQVQQLELVGRNAEGAGLIAYFEYDTPDLLSVLSAETARESAARLAAELDGTHDTRQSNTPLRNIGVLAHSYGTPVAANALLLTTHPVHTVTLIASAGLDGERVRSLADLNVDRDSTGRPKIYSTMARTDTTAPFGSNVSGRLQPNPRAAWTDELFLGGAQIFSSDGDGELNHTQGHSIVREDEHGYLDKRTQSLDGVAKLTLGLHGHVRGGLSVADERAPGAWNDAHDMHKRSRK